MACVIQISGIPSQRCSPETTVPEDIVSFNGSCFEFATKSGQVRHTKVYGYIKGFVVLLSCAIMVKPISKLFGFGFVI